MLAKNNARSQELGKQSYAAILASETKINLIEVFWMYSLINTSMEDCNEKFPFFLIFFSFLNDPAKAEKNLHIIQSAFVMC